MLAFDDAPIVTASARVAAHRATSAAARAEAIEQLGALLCATQAELVDVITAADAERDWRVDGATGMASWLVATLHVATATAREWVRAGAALDGLPHLREAFGAGMLAWDQVRPAASFVTPATDERHAEDLQGCSAAQVEDLARQHKARRPDAAHRSARQRGFHSRVDHDNGGRRYTGFLPDAEAARFDVVIDRIADGYGPDPETGLYDPIFVRRADALLELADQRAAADADPDTCLVVVHADADVVDGKVAGNGSIEGLQVPAESVLRLLCDCKIEFHIDGPHGTTIGIGRADRSIPRWLRRRIRKRDGWCCRFPGCDRPIRQIHHLAHWVRDEGSTDACNLCGLCWWHHRVVHEGGWSITGSADRELAFTNPYGRTLRSRPQPLSPWARERASDAIGIPLSEEPPSHPRAGPAP